MGKALPGRVISSFSGDEGCVEVRWDTRQDMVAVCDSTDRETEIFVSEADWSAFLDGVVNREFMVHKLKEKAEEAATQAL